MAYQKKERRENTASFLTLDLSDKSQQSTPAQREKRGRDGQRNIDSGIIDECIDLPSFSDPEEYRDRLDSGLGLNEIERPKSPKASATISEKSSSVLFEEGVDIKILGNSDASDEDHTPTEETGGTFPEILALEDKQSQGAPEPGINRPSSLSCHHVLSPSATDMGTSSPLKGDPEEKVSGSTTPDTDLSPSEEEAGKYSPHFSDKGNMSSPSLLVPALPVDVSTSVNKNKCPTIGYESLDMPGSAPLYTIPMPTQADLGKQFETSSLSPYVSPTQENDEKSLVFSGSTKSDCTVPPSQQDRGKFQNGHDSDGNDLLTSRPPFPHDIPPSGTSSSSSSLNLTEYNDCHVFHSAIPAMDDIAPDEAEKMALRIQLSEALERIPDLQNTVADLEKTVYELRQQLEMEIPDKADLSCIERERLEAEVRKLKHQLKEDPVGDAELIGITERLLSLPSEEIASILLKLGFAQSELDVIKELEPLSNFLLTLLFQARRRKYVGGKNSLALKLQRCGQQP